MSKLDEVLLRNVVYWDIGKFEVVLEKDAMKPEWAYFELRIGELDNTITEYYKDGDLRLTLMYATDTPRKKVIEDRNFLFNSNKGNWTKYMVTMPKEEFKKTIKLYYFGD